MKPPGGKHSNSMPFWLHASFGSRRTQRKHHRLINRKSWSKIDGHRKTDGCQPRKRAETTGPRTEQGKRPPKHSVVRGRGHTQRPLHSKLFFRQRSLATKVSLHCNILPLPLDNRCSRDNCPSPRPDRRTSCCGPNGRSAHP
jgi:hypothetical protein